MGLAVFLCAAILFAAGTATTTKTYSPKDPRTWSSETLATLPFTLTGEEYVWDERAVYDDAEAEQRAYPTTRGTIFCRVTGPQWFELSPAIWQEGDDPIYGPNTGSILTGMRKTSTGKET